VIRRVAACLTCLVAVGPVAAQDCAPRSVAASYASAQQRGAEFTVALGALRPFRAGAEPDVRSDPSHGSDRAFPMQFEGTFFNGTGFGGQTVVVDVTVEVFCSGGRCGPVDQTDNALFFFRRGPERSLVLEAHICPIYLLPNPTRDERRQVAACAQSGC
jgi:hypothetical protein